MAGHNYLPTSKQLWTPGPVDVKYGPFNSISEFKTWYEGELGELYRGITVGIIQQDGTIKEYWNGDSSSVNDFILKFNSGSGGSVSSSDTIYAIKASDWNLTVGEMQKDANGHYSSLQYSQMWQNGKGISDAVKYAYDNGYTKIVLPKGTYCFCTRSTNVTLPSIVLYDLNNVDLDLNDSTLKLCVDSSENNPYENKTNSYEKTGALVNISYCRNTTVRNGFLVGDRLERSYTQHLETHNESTTGISIGAGNRNISILDCDIREFMGDSISSIGYGWFKGFPTDDTTEGSSTYRNLKYMVGADYGAQHDWFKASRNISYIVENGLPKNTSKFLDTALTNGYIDLDILYQDDLDCKNRRNDAQERIFTLGNNQGYTRMTECYPYAVGIITYASNDVNAQPIRMFESSYCQRVVFGPSERYIKFQYSYEDNLASDYDSSKTYSYGELVSKLEEDVIGYYKCVADRATGEWDSSKWEFMYVQGVGGAEDYSSATTYYAGAVVKKNMGQYRVGYKCSQNNVTGTFDRSKWAIIKRNREFVSEVNHYQLVPTECQTHGVYISGCKIYNNHRGGISNLPHESVVENCDFVKNYHMNGDGALYPNVGGGDSWATDYFIDQEDIYSSQITLRNCNFIRNSSMTGKILLGCLRAEVSNCTGCGRFLFYSGSSLTIMNNEFEEFSYDYMPSNWSATSYPARHVKRDVVIAHNKIHKCATTPVLNQNNQIIISENFIYEMSSNGGVYNLMGESADFIFTNNFVKGLNGMNTGNILCYNAYKLSGNRIDIADGKYRVTSPCYGNGTTIKANSVLFTGTDTETTFKGLAIESQDLVGICSSINNNKKAVHNFIDCDISASLGGNGFMFGFSSTNRDEAGVIELHFTRCRFRTTSGNSIISPNSTHGSLPGSSVPFAPDEIRLIFEECVFECTSNTFGSDNQYRTITAAAKKCTFNHNYTINGNVLYNTIDAVDIDTSIPSVALDNHAPSTKLLKDVKETLETAISGKASSSHTHAQSDITGLGTALSNINTAIGDKANATHTHTQSDITGLGTALSGKAESSHTHAIADVTGLETALSGKAASVHTHTDLYNSDSYELSADPNTMIDNRVVGFRGSMSGINANYPQYAFDNENSPLNCLMTVCRHYSGLYIYQILQTKNGTWYRNGVKTGETPSWSGWTKQSIGTNFISSPTENPDNIVSPATYYYEGTYVTPEGGEPVVANANYPSNAFQYNDLGGALGSTLAVEINPNNLRIRQILTTPYGKWARYAARANASQSWSWSSWTGFDLSINN